MTVEDRSAILRGLERAVISGKRDIAIRYAKRVIKEGLDPVEAIDEGLIKGINVIGDRYAHREIFLPQVLLASDALYGALDILLPHIPKEDQRQGARVVIGVVEGDVHDIGKNLVKTMLIAAGFRVHDLGKDQSEEAFVKGVRKFKAHVVAMSTLMTPTMESMKATVDALVEGGLRQDLTIIIGGAPTSQEFADEIGADLYGLNANEAVRKLQGSQ
jgi:corrinoid protein of di/trimethylamine methyltransferase